MKLATGSPSKAHSRPVSRSDSTASNRWIVIGALLTVMMVLWTLVSATINGGSPIHLCIVAIATAVAYRASRLLTTRNSRLVPALVVLAAGFLAALTKPYDLLTSGLRPPLGYSNATAALYTLAAAAAALWFLATTNTATRAFAAAAGLAFAAVPFLNDTRTAVLLLLLLPVAVYAAVTRKRRALIIGMAALLTLVLSTTVLLGFQYDETAPRTGVASRLVDGTLSERRVALWHDAVNLIRAHPLLGVGPTRFATTSPVARRDTDTRWPHNEFLHLGAEAGVPAILLLLAIVGCGFAALWHAADARGAAIGAFALGAASIHASVDYVLHFPAVPIAAAAVIAASMGRNESSRNQRISRSQPA